MLLILLLRICRTWDSTMQCQHNHFFVMAVGVIKSLLLTYSCCAGDGSAGASPGSSSSALQALLQAQGVVCLAAARAASSL
jgi:hypothetical protein